MSARRRAWIDLAIGHVATSTSPSDDGQFQARILGAVAKKESDDKSRRIRRKHEELAAGWPASLVAAARPFGYEADKKTLVRRGGGDREECARRLLGGESIRSICANLNERGVATVSGGRVVAADAASAPRCRRGSAASANTTASLSRWRSGPRSSPRAETRGDPGAAFRPGPAYQPRRPPLPAGAACCAAATAASRSSRAPAREASAATSARSGPKLLRLRQYLRSWPTRSSSSSSRLCSTGLTRRSLPPPSSGSTTSDPGRGALADGGRAVPRPAR